MKLGSAVRNFGASYINFFLSALLNFWFVPFLVRTLGVEAYGLVPLAMQITSYMALATLALNAATSRYVMQAISKGQHDQASAIFNTAVFSTFALVAALVLPASYVAYSIDEFITIPSSVRDEARWLFSATFAAFLVGALRGPFEVAMFCKNRLDIQNLISALETAIKVGVTVALFLMANVSLGNAGIGILTAACSTAMLSIASWKLLMPELKLDSKSFDLEKLRPLTTIGGWTVVNQVGSIFFLSVDLVIANRFLGVQAAGIYAALLMWPMMIRTMAGYIAVNFTPTFVHLNAKEDKAELAKYGILSVRVMGLLTVGPIFILSGLSAPILAAWLGADWVKHQYLLDILLLNLVFNVPVVSLFGLAQATTNMKTIGLVTLATGLMNIVTAIILSVETSLGLWGIAVAGIVWFNIKNGIFLPSYIKKVLGHLDFSVFKLYSALAPTLIAGFLVWLGMRFLLISPSSNHGWIEIGFISVVAEGIFLFLFFLLPGTTIERQYVVTLTNKLLVKVGMRKSTL